MTLKNLLRMGFVYAPDDDAQGGFDDSDLGTDLGEDEPSAPPAAPEPTFTQAQVEEMIEKAAALAVARAKAEPPAPKPQPKVSATDEIPDNDDDLRALRAAAMTYEEKDDLTDKIAERIAIRAARKAQDAARGYVNEFSQAELERRKPQAVKQLVTELAGDVGEEGSNYVEEFLSTLAPTQLANMTERERDLMRNAARGAQEAKRGPRTTAPRTGTNAAGITPPEKRDSLHELMAKVMEISYEQAVTGRP